MKWTALFLMTILLSLPSVANAQSMAPLKPSVSMTPASANASGSTRSSRPNSTTSSGGETVCEVCKKRLAECSAERPVDGERIRDLSIDNANLKIENRELRRRPGVKDGIAGALFATGTLLATFGALRDTGDGEVHRPDTALIVGGSGLVVVGLIALFWPQ